MKHLATSLIVALIVALPLFAQTHRFQQFTGLLRKDPDTTVRVTAVGRFFSGNKVTGADLTYWRGYGHLGCCSLLALQRIESFEAHVRSDLDYTAEAGW